MKRFIIGLLIACSFTALSQEKPSYFYDELHHRISKDSFYSRVNPKVHLAKVVENDTVIVGMLVLRSVYGKLEAQKKARLVTMLERITKTKIEKDETIVINFFYDFKSELSSMSKDRRYLKFFKSNNNQARFRQFFITHKGYKMTSKLAAIFEDVNGEMRKLFFPFKFEGGNYLVVYPNNDYHKYYGKHSQKKIIDELLKRASLQKSKR